MIYVYIRNWGIVKKSKEIVNGIAYDEMQQVKYNVDDKLIYEKGKVIKYEESELYKKDKWIIWVAEERDLLKQELEKQVKENDVLINDYLRLRAKYDLLRKRQIPEDDLLRKRNIEW